MRKPANPIYLTRKERSKIYHAKKIKNRVHVSSVSKSKDERKKQILAYMKNMQEIISCPALGEDVMIVRKGREETADKARLSVRSMVTALNLEDALQNAIFIKQITPKKTRSQSCFHTMYLLICPIKGFGYAKIIVGKFFSAPKLPTLLAHYCVTHISLRELKM